MAAFKNRIGYYNHNGYPVQFTLRSGRAAPLNLEPGQPITGGPHKHLVPPGQAELDEEVRMGTIAYIFADNPKHKEFLQWNAKADQRESVVFKGQSGLAAESQVEKTSTSPNKRKLQPAPDVTVSASRAPIDTAALEESERRRVAANQANQEAAEEEGEDDGEAGEGEEEGNEDEDGNEEEAKATAKAPEPIIRPGESLDAWLERQGQAGKAQVLGNHYIKYDGQTFKNKKALSKYLELSMAHQPKG